MRLHHHYATAPPPTYLGVYHHHQGQGFGSVFARLFSKVAAKTAAKTALSAAKVAGRKVLRVAAKQGTQLARQAAQKGLAGAKKLGTELAMQGIDALEQAAIKKGVPAEAVHNVSNIVREGANKTIHRVGSIADQKIKGIASKIDSRIERVKQPVGIDIGEIRIEPSAPPRAEKKTRATIVGGSKIQNHKRRKRKLTTATAYPRQLKRVKISTGLQNLIDES